MGANMTRESDVLNSMLADTAAMYLWRSPCNGSQIGKGRL